MIVTYNARNPNGGYAVTPYTEINDNWWVIPAREVSGQLEEIQRLDDRCRDGDQKEKKEGNKNKERCYPSKVHDVQMVKAKVCERVKFISSAPRIPHCIYRNPQVR